MHTLLLALHGRDADSQEKSGQRPAWSNTPEDVIPCLGRKKQRFPLKKSHQRRITGWWIGLRGAYSALGNDCDEGMETSVSEF